MKNKPNRDQTILIIDDNSETRETASCLLKETGYKVATAAYGQARAVIRR